MNRLTRTLLAALALLLAVPLTATPAAAERVKDLAAVRGVRSNQLIGYGIVIGLNGTGDSDKTTFTIQSIVAMLARNNVRIDAAGLKLKNVAAVMVTADLPAFARAGNRIDVTVSSIGDAKSLNGGTLIVTPIKGHDGNVYAVAQGPLTVGGYSIGAGGGEAEIKNHPTVGRIPDGAIVEREVPVTLQGKQAITLQLRDSDFTTAARMAKVLNMNLGGVFAKALDSGTVTVEIPAPYRERMVEFIALVERLEVTPDSRARVVINERTGTVIIGQDVRITPVAVAHGNITVSIRTPVEAVPPAPFTAGEPTVVADTQLDVLEEKQNLIEVQGQSLSDVVEGLNRLGTSPRDLMTILQAIKQAGALRADLEVM